MLTIPFVGSKRDRLKEVVDIVKKGGYTRVVEPFGGSCVMSVNAHRHTGAECFANDYDRFFENFEETLQVKDDLMDYLLSKGLKKSKGKKVLPEEHRQILQEAVAPLTPNQRKFLSSNFLFSAKRTSYTGEGVKDFRYFVNDITTEKNRLYWEALQQITLDNLDYKDFIEKYVPQGDDKTLVLLDPPYLNSYQKSYENETYFGLSDTIKLLHIITQKEVDYILFNQRSEDIVALVSLFSDQFEVFKREKSIAKGNNIIREDVMIYVTRE